MMMNNPISWTLLLLAIAGNVQAAQQHLPGRVIRVVDGDSLVLDVRGSQYQVELAGIDAPELNQPWGQAAAERLYATLTGAFVVVEAAGTGDTMQLVGRVGFKGRDVALDQLSDGLAWSTVGLEPESRDPDHPYNRAEAGARTERRGLWSDAQPIPPWQWRNQGPDRPWEPVR